VLPVTLQDGIEKNRIKHADREIGPNGIHVPIVNVMKIEIHIQIMGLLPGQPHRCQGSTKFNGDSAVSVRYNLLGPWTGFIRSSHVKNSFDTLLSYKFLKKA